MCATMKKLFKNYVKSERGVAAIETALIMPIMLIMYIGMIDLTSLVSMNRKLTQAASTLADVITQSKDTIDESNVSDIFNAVDLIMIEGAADVALDITVEGYRKVGGVATKQWSKSRGVCTAAVDTTKMLLLMDANNDIIVAKVCTEFFPFAGNVLGHVILGADSIKMNEVITERPRLSDQLSCYKSATHTVANLCS
jgi:Flp pilus assembly pilin Flp